VHKPKATVFGPTILYDAERCIVCTRCIRFVDEVAKDPVLALRERGNLNEVVVAPGRQLDNPYTLMTEYVCPVGALTATDFRFKARVWFLRSARTVCQGCATGCNAFLDYDPRDGKVYRHRPRENMAVNKYWMCDEGMLDYHRVDTARVLRASIGKEEATVGAALDRAARALKGIAPERLAVVLSAQHSSEDNFALITLARDVLGCTNFFISGKPNGQGDQVLRHPDKNPNTRGVTWLAASASSRTMQDLSAASTMTEFTTILALGSETKELADATPLAGAKERIVLAVHQGPLSNIASVLLPASSWAESDGTYVNARGLSQESEQAIGPRGDSRPAWKLLAGLAMRLGKDLGWRKIADVRRAMSAEAPPPSLPGSNRPAAGVTS
jgi:NADH-quinone oxidoreductase subunit G